MVALAEMKAFMTGDAVETPAAKETPAPVEMPADETVEAKTDEAEQPAEVETKPEGQEAATEEKPDLAKAEEAKRASGYQKLKAKAEVLSQEVAKARSESHEALTIANSWRAEALALREQLGRVLQDASRTGYQPDPRDFELFRAKRQLEDQQLRQQLETARQEREQKHTADGQRAELAAQYREEASVLKSKYPGLEPKQILLAYANTLEAGLDLSMEQVAQNLAQAAGIKNPAREQRRVNQSAPRTLKPGQGVPSSYPATKDGMKAFLSSTGV